MPPAISRLTLSVLLAVALSALLGHSVEAIVIGIIVLSVMPGVVGFVRQKTGAEKRG